MNFKYRIKNFKKKLLKANIQKQDAHQWLFKIHTCSLVQSLGKKNKIKKYSHHLERDFFFSYITFHIWELVFVLWDSPSLFFTALIHIVWRSKKDKKFSFIETAM